jgi:hypothetical protein
MARAATADSVLEAAIEVAQGAATEMPGPPSGRHLGFRLEGHRFGTHLFESLEPGYRGWQWAVTVARAPRSRHATVCEVEMIPGDGALVAPPWLPWAERLRPGDLGAQDVLPYQSDDVRLDQGYEQTDDEEADRVAHLGARARPGARAVRRGACPDLRPLVRGGPRPERPERPPDQAQCSTCGFFMKIAGAGRVVFGVCANEWSPSDGRIVSVDHGCGAHSETDGPRPVASGCRASP